MPIMICGWDVRHRREESAGQVGSLVSPQPGKAVFITTDISPVDWSAAVMPGELSTMTLSPKIPTRTGSSRLAAGMSTWPIGTVPAAFWTAAFDTVAWATSGGPTVPATITAVVARTPAVAMLTAGTRNRRANAPQSARRSGRSTR